jgi:hypothetical protein
LRAASIRASTSPEFIEDRVLERDRQRQNAVEPALDRREVVGEAAFLLKLEAGALAEIGKADAGELALMQQMIPAGQRLAGVIALEVVGRIEQVLPARLPLATRQRAKRIEAAGDGRDETPLAAAIGGDGAEHRRRGLMGAVGAAKALDGAVSPPARLQQEVHPALLVLGVEAGVVGAARAARIREDEDALGPPMKALASASDWLAVRDSSRWLPSGKVTNGGCGR